MGVRAVGPSLPPRAPHLPHANMHWAPITTRAGRVARCPLQASSGQPFRGKCRTPQGEGGRGTDNGESRRKTNITADGVARSQIRPTARVKWCGKTQRTGVAVTRRPGEPHPV